MRVRRQGRGLVPPVIYAHLDGLAEVEAVLAQRTQLAHRSSGEASQGEGEGEGEVAGAMLGPSCCGST